MRAKVRERESGRGDGGNGKEKREERKKKRESRGVGGMRRARQTGQTHRYDGAETNKDMQEGKGLGVKAGGAVLEVKN